MNHEGTPFNKEHDSTGCDCADAQSRCLNCGETLPDGVRFCPQCGLPAATGRLGSKNVAIDSLGTITRLNKGVFYTCFNLIWRPWKVIAGYIHGQRVKYTDPVKLLIGLCFILIGLKALFRLGDGAELAPAHPDDSPLIHFLRFFATSDTLQCLVVFLPVAPVIMFVNRKHKTFHYNFAECFVGALYMSDAMIVLELLCLPVLAFGIDISSYVVMPYLAVMGSVLVYKSFGHLHLSRGRRIAKLLWTITLMLISYILLLTLAAIIALIYFSLTHPEQLTAVS